MINFLNKSFKGIMYSIFIIIVMVSLYNIYLNFSHYKILDEKAYVSEIDVDYKEYKDNILEIENNLNNYVGENNSLYLSLNHTLTLLKKDGVFRLMPKTKIGYYELNELNEYFMEVLINNCWIANLSLNLENNYYNEMINLLVANSNYLHSHFINNGLYLSKGNYNKKINSDYQLILKNYREFSFIIRDLSQNLGGNDE